MRHTLRTEVDIAATPDEVWRRLTNFADYPDWNPFITSVLGVAAVGQRLTVRLDPPGGRGITMRPTVTDVVPGRALEWLGRLGIPGVFDGRHRFELHETPSGTRLVHGESFHGLLVRPMRGALDGSTRAGFVAMNDALARRVLRDRAEA
jgi:hypothetical protein